MPGLGGREGMNSAYPVDGYDEILSSYIYDYLTKRGFAKTASTLKDEVESITPSDRAEKCRLQPPTVDMPSGFLFEWFVEKWLEHTLANGLEHHWKRSQD